MELQKITPGNGAGETPDRLITSHVGLVRKIARSIHHRTHGAVEYDELQQAGMLALVEAAFNYEDLGHSFSTYAAIRIRGQITDELRRRSRLSRGSMTWLREIESVRKTLRQTLRCEPGERDTARALGMASAEYRERSDAAQKHSEEPLDHAYSDSSAAFADPSDDREAMLLRNERSFLLERCLNALPHRESTVLRLYFFEERSLDDIGAMLEVGAARVCQIKKAALARLKTTLAPVGAD